VLWEANAILREGKKKEGKGGRGTRSAEYAKQTAGFLAGHDAWPADALFSSQAAPAAENKRDPRETRSGENRGDHHWEERKGKGRKGGGDITDWRNISQ